MKKILLIAVMIMLCGIGISEARDVSLEATTEVTIQTDRNYEFSFMGLSDIDAELESTVATVGVDIGIGNLTLNPFVGIWNSEMEIAELITLENSAGLCLGLNAEYLFAEVDVDDENAVGLSLVAEYLFADSEVDDIKFANMSIELPLKNDINRHDIFAGIKAEYAGLPLDATLSLAMGYSRSEIDLGASLGMIDIDLNMESDGFSIRPGLSIEPIEGLTIDIEGAFVDQIAGSVKVAYVF